MNYSNQTRMFNKHLNKITKGREDFQMHDFKTKQRAQKLDCLHQQSFIKKWDHIRKSKTKILPPTLPRPILVGPI